MNHVSNLVYIMSPSYSGSTLLTCLLARHDQITTIGELKATSMGDIDSYQCSCGKPIRNCQFWTGLGERLARRGIAFDPGSFGTHFADGGGLVDRLLRGTVRGPLTESLRGLALRWWPPGRDAYRRLLERNRVLIDNIAEAQQRPVFLDGSKDPVRLRLLLAGESWKIKVIHLIRDGRGTACSYMTHNHTSMQAAAGEWRTAQLECQRMLARLGARDWLQVRYEELCTATDAVLADILRFLGLPRMSDLRQEDELHILGNKMRLTDDNRIRLDERWKTALSADDLADFERVAGSINRSLGYQ